MPTDSGAAAAPRPEHWSTKRLRVHHDGRGSLAAVEAMVDVPFAIRRVYYLFGVPPGSARGFHAHRTLEQLAVAVSGSCTFRLEDGKREEEVRLCRPDVGLHIGSMVWREMRDFSADCVLMVLASDLYDEADYIRDRGEFLRLASTAGAQ